MEQTITELLNFSFSLALSSVAASLKMASLVAGFVVSTQVCHSVYADQPITMLVIDKGFDFVVILVSSVCLAYMN